jgi:hypothetical protein
MGISGVGIMAKPTSGRRDEMTARGAAAAAKAPEVILPCNVDAERSILGAIILDGSPLCPEALSVGLEPGHFSLDSHRRIYGSMLEMCERGLPIDILTLSEHMSARKELAQVGGAAYLSSLTDGTPRRGSIAHYIRIVKTKARLRDVIRGAELVQLGAREPDADLLALADRMADIATRARADLDVGNWRGLFHSCDDFLNAPPLQFAINGFAQEAGIGLIGGLVGHGKTLVMLAMVQAILEQSPLFGCKLFEVPRPAERVLYLIPESAIGPFWSRIKLFHLEEHVQADRLLVRTLSSKEQVALNDVRILKAAEGADVFLDTAVRFMDGAENDAENAKVFADTLFRLLAAGARTITGAHHAPKGFENQDRMTLENVLRGSGDIGAMLSTCWGVRQVDANSNRLYVENLKARDFQPCGAFVLEGRPHLDVTGQFKVVEAPGAALELREYLTRGRGGAPGTPDKGEKLQKAVELRAGGASLREIAAALSITKSTASRWLAEYDAYMSRDLSHAGQITGQGSIPGAGEKTQ